MNMEKLDNRKVQRALEETGNYNANIEDSTHGFLNVEITKRKLPVTQQTKWFLCCSTPKCPNLCVGNCDKALHGKMLQSSWDRHASAVGEEEELDMETEESAPAQSPQQPTPCPHQQDTTPTATTVSPTLASPSVLKDDNDLLDFFRGMMRSDHLSKEDMFCDDVSSGSLRAKIASFGKTLAAEDRVKLTDQFCDSTAPGTHVAKDITTMPPDPCLSNKHGMPMRVQAMREVATAMLKLAEDAPEMLQLQKQSGSKGSGKKLVAMVPSTEKHRLYQNSRQWMEEAVRSATTDESALSTCDVIKVLIRVLLAFDRLAFNHVAADVPESNHSKLKLDPEFQQAMTLKANLNESQVRTIKSCCSANMDMSQPETVMRSLESTDFVKPTTVDFKESGTRTKVAWHMPADELLQCNANKALQANSFDFCTALKVTGLLSCL